MNLIEIPMWILTFSIGLTVFLLLACIFFVYKYISVNFMDRLIFIDNNKRWNMISEKVKHLEKYEYEGKFYNLSDKAGNLNRKGKVLYIFSIGNPNPLATIQHQMPKYLDGQTLKNVISNDLIRQIITPKQSIKDIMIYLGVIASFLAMVSAGLNLLIGLGIIKPTP